MVAKYLEADRVKADEVSLIYKHVLLFLKINYVINQGSQAAKGKGQV